MGKRSLKFHEFMCMFVVRTETLDKKIFFSCKMQYLLVVGVHKNNTNMFNKILYVHRCIIILSFL